jgi:ferredoxin
VGFQTDAVGHPLARKSPYRPFTPKPEQQALYPEVSGNTINGLGERQIRRADPIYWHEPASLAHGELQKWFYTQDPDNPAIAEARKVRAAIHAEHLPAVAEEPLEQSAQQWTNQLKAFADRLDLELLGITRLNPEWVFSNQALSEQWVIMVGVAHDYQQIQHAPQDLAGAEVVRQYGRGAKAVKQIAGWIRERGHDAQAHPGPMAGAILQIPHAIECGFGELGKHGSIINRQYGASFRLACVTTDIPLLPSQADFYGVDDFCDRCQVCANACPPEAILPDKVWVRGTLKWYVDFDKCVGFFNENHGCAICIAVCPFSLPGRGPRIAEQLKRRRQRQQREGEAPGSAKGDQSVS